MNNDTAPGGAGPTPPPPPPPGPHGPYIDGVTWRQRPIYRSTDNSMLGGVAGGLGAYLKIDPLLIRVALVILALAGGIGIGLYLLAFLLIPSERDVPGGVPVNQLSRQPRARSWWVWVVGILAVLFIIGGLNVGSGFFWAFLLIGVGALLLLSDRSPTTSPPVATGPYPGGDPVPGSVAAHDTAVMTPAYGAVPPPPAPLARKRREPSVLFPLTVGLALVALALAVILDRSDLVEASDGQVAAIPMLVLGAGLLVGSWFGRGRLLILPVLVLTPFLFATINDPSMGTEPRVEVVRPASVDELQPRYDHDAGRLVIDLSAVALGDGRTDLRAEIGAGELEVIVPSGVTTTVEAVAGLGRVEVFGRAEGGPGAEIRETFPGARGDLHLDLRSGVGQVRVSSAAAPVVSAVPSSPPLPGPAPSVPAPTPVPEVQS